ncbi:PREDICTED: voltage-dependent calcium channel gamma-1 subunit [Mandrillus leucophaeus]|uniref:voltage-dependent calcium channel gamma-1 subunit n=1 Tax=Mandrillus leucophaeus TaxID=9568 RepID=UPI0005F3AB81|nr:PREDICTED: voltage-dependent calcium channel gamma-1 subunit [Mandrillus leucophaeus]
MSQTKTLKVRVTLFCILAGIVLAMTAVVTDHWAVLSPHMEHHNTTCEAAHFGLWRICTKRIPMDDSKTCGPITLPGAQTLSELQSISSPCNLSVFLDFLPCDRTTCRRSFLSKQPAATQSLAFIWWGFGEPNATCAGVTSATHRVQTAVLQQSTPWPSSQGPPLGRILTDGFRAVREAADGSFPSSASGEAAAPTFGGRRGMVRDHRLKEQEDDLGPIKEGLHPPKKTLASLQVRFQKELAINRLADHPPPQCLLPCHSRKVSALERPPATCLSPLPPVGTLQPDALGRHGHHESSWTEAACRVSLVFAEYSISAAAIAIFSLGFVILGSLCVLLSFGKKRDYLLRPASMFYAFAGLCILVSVEVMRQSVKRMIDSEDTVWIEYYYSWSFACACAAFVLLFLGGLALLLFSLPRMPRNPWESCMDAEPEH